MNTPELSKRIHDLKSVHYDFQAVLRLLQSGYRFDDEEAPRVFAQLERALQHLNQEIEHLRAQHSQTNST